MQDHVTKIAILKNKFLSLDNDSAPEYPYGWIGKNIIYSPVHEDTNFVSFNGDTLVLERRYRKFREKDYWVMY